MTLLFHQFCSQAALIAHSTSRAPASTPALSPPVIFLRKCLAFMRILCLKPVKRKRGRPRKSEPAERPAKQVHRQAESAPAPGFAAASSVVPLVSVLSSLTRSCTQSSEEHVQALMSSPEFLQLALGQLQWCALRCVSCSVFLILICFRQDERAIASAHRPS